MSGGVRNVLISDTLVLGCWPLGGPARNLGTAMGWGDVDDATSEAVIHAALDTGVRRFDTADAYGLGLSETRLGQALSGVPRDSIEINSKVGYLQPSDGTPLWTYDNLRRALHDSLERLQTTRLDTYFVHHNALDQEQTELLAGVLQEFRTSGLIMKVGIRGPHRFSPERTNEHRVNKRDQYAEMLHAIKPDVVSLRANLLTPAATLAPAYGWAAGVGAEVQVYKPLAQGLLTNAFPREFPTFGSGDHRSKKGWFSPPAHPALMRLRADICETVPGSSPLETALAWVLVNCPDSRLVMGSQNPDHVREWRHLALPELTQEQLVELETVASRYRSSVPSYLD